MVDWTETEAEFLQANWAKSGDILALPVACPHCLHNGAFSEVIVLPWAPSQRRIEREGPLSDSDLADKASLGPAYPAAWPVACGCGDAEHSDAGGCGRKGYVNVKVPGS